MLMLAMLSFHALPAQNTYDQTPCGESVKGWSLSNLSAQWIWEMVLNINDSVTLDSIATRERIVQFLKGHKNVQYLKDTTSGTTFLLDEFAVSFEDLGYSSKDVIYSWWNTSYKAYCNIEYQTGKIVFTFYNIRCYSTLADVQTYRTIYSKTYRSIRNDIFKKNGCFKFNKSDISTSLEALGKGFYELFIKQLE